MGAARGLQGNRRKAEGAVLRRRGRRGLLLSLEGVDLPLHRDRVLRLAPGTRKLPEAGKRVPLRILHVGSVDQARPAAELDPQQRTARCTVAFRAGVALMVPQAAI